MGHEVGCKHTGPGMRGGGGGEAEAGRGGRAFRWCVAATAALCNCERSRRVDHNQPQPRLAATTSPGGCQPVQRTAGTRHGIVAATAPRPHSGGAAFRIGRPPRGTQAPTAARHVPSGQWPAQRPAPPLSHTHPDCQSPTARAGIFVSGIKANQAHVPLFPPLLLLNAERPCIRAPHLLSSGDW